MLTEDGGASGDVAIPPTIHALLAARLDRLEPEERAVIERASVIGKEFWRGAITELTPVEERESAGPRLMTLTRKEFIEPATSIFPDEDGFRFRHILIRDAAYLGVPKETRADLHERYAAWLERTTGQQASEIDEILGYHLEQAFQYRAELGPVSDKATELAASAGERLGRAGRRAMVGGGDVAAAASLMSRAVALLPDERPLRRELLTELGSARMMTGDFAGAGEAIEEAVASASAAGDARVESRALIEREFYKTFAGSEDATLTIPEVTAKAIPILEEAGDHLGLARAWRLRSELDIRAAHWGARSDALERALEHAPHGRGSAGGRVPRRHARPVALLRPDPGRRGDRALRAVPATTCPATARSRRRSGAPSPGCMRCAATSTRRASSGRAADKLYEALHLSFRRAARSYIPASIETLAGDYDAAERELRWGYETLEQMGEKSLRTTIAGVPGRSGLQAGARR